MPKISIIIPVYNTEKYLEECLNSTMEQTLQDIEIICINDGSTDKSLAIIKKAMRKDKRIVLLNKANSGYGDSMNQGIALARGKYIAILESDDFIEKDMCEALVDLAERERAEIVRANYFHHSKKRGDVLYSSVQKQVKQKAISINDDPSILLDAPAIWSAIYLTSFLRRHQIHFLPTPGASYQDTSFGFKALASAERIVYTEIPYLHYRVDNMGSSVKSLEKTHYVCDEFAEIDRYLEATKKSDQIKQLAQVAKFKAYLWNIRRLSRADGIRFLIETRQIFEELMRKELIERKCFPRRYWWQLQLVLKAKTPIAYETICIKNTLRSAIRK